MEYEVRNFENLLGTEGFSNELLKNHFTLYHENVMNTNRLFNTLRNLEEEEKTGTPQYAELKRRFGWEWNGMRLHEYYFENMTQGGRPLERDTELYRKLTEDFGSYENWEKDFKAVGSMRGLGWAILYYDTAAGKLFNTWVNEYDTGHLCGASPVLVMDAFEHAYMVDYGVKRADYIEAFLKAIDWTTAITMSRNKLPLILGSSA